MNWNRLLRIIAGLLFLTCIAVSYGLQFPRSTAGANTTESQNAQQQPEGNELFIQTDSQLLDTYPQARYEVHLITRGGVPPLRWQLEKGKGILPPGIKLEDNGLLHGAAERAGEFQFTLSVTDSGSPHRAVEKSFILRVRSGLALLWKSPARVEGNRIEGSVEVSNQTPDDMDLTFIVLAVAGNGRATAIGYQHFKLAKGATDKELPFGETLPNGGYVVHVDVVGEVPPKKLIYRERMETPGLLHVVVGP